MRYCSNVFFALSHFLHSSKKELNFYEMIKFVIFFYHQQIFYPLQNFFKILEKPDFVKLPTPIFGLAIGSNMADKIRLNRVRKLTLEHRRMIVDLYESGNYTMVAIAEMFGISQPRVSQIVNNVYLEMGDLIETKSN